MRKFSFVLTAALAAVTYLRAADATLPPGTNVIVRTIDAIESKSAEVGKTYMASLDSPVFVNGQEVAKKGDDATLRVIQIDDAGRLKGKTELTVTLVSVKSGAKVYQVSRSNVTLNSAGKGKGSAAKIGGGAAIGAAIGAIAGGGRGAAIGAGAGAGAGAAAAMLTGPQVKIPSESVLTFRVQ